MNPPVPPEPDPPEPDPPEPGVTYSLTANITYGAGSTARGAILSLAYMMSSEGTEWTTVDSEQFTGGAGGTTASITLEGIPQGAARARLSIAPANPSTTVVSMRHPNEAWVTELTFGSGNDGWDSDYDTNIIVQISAD